MNRRKTALLLIAGIALMGVAAAHHHPQYFILEEYTNPEVALSDTGLFWTAVYWIWGFHDRIHWIFIILMLYTCYHFRFFYGRNVLKHPGKCSWDRDPGYDGERTLMQWHRFFWYGNIVLITIHWTEWVEGVRMLLLTPYKEFTYIFWPLTDEAVIHQGAEAFALWQQGIGVGAELFYLVAVTFWLLSCHFYRYFTAWDSAGCCGGGCECSNGSNKKTEAAKDVPWILRLNRKHGIFMWLSITASALLILIGGHL